MSDEILAAVGEQLEHGIVVLDAEDMVRYANPAARRLGSFVDRYEGRRLADATRDYRLVRIAATCRDTGREVQRELAEVRPDRTLLVTAVPVVDDAAAVVCLLIRDESRMIRVETMRRDFVANVSHELRTPLTAIQLLVETLQREEMMRGATAADFVGKIGLEVRHMAQMVEELLELSTIESGRRPLDFSDTPVPEVMAGIDRLRPLALERGVALRVDVPAELPHLQADATRLAQVIRNLVHNALKFTPQGGTVTVRASADGAASTILITVADTGVGIDSQDLSRIFERFWKADRSRGRDGEGSGLGLAIARHIVEGHGGRITVQSEPRKGATFTVVLPLRPDAAAAPDSSA